MKKGLFSILAGALLVVGCQNYDDQFSNIESQITALASQVAGLSQVQSDLTSLAGTVNALQANIGDTVDAALADGLADIDTAVASLEAATESAASSEDVAAIADAVADQQEDLDAILQASQFFTGDIIVTNAATLETYHNARAGFKIINGKVSISASSDMDMVKVQELVDAIQQCTGDFDYTAGSGVTDEIYFNGLTSTASLTLKQKGGYELKTLSNATNISLDYDPTTDIVHLGALTTVTSLKSTGDAAGTFHFKKAKEMHLTALPRYTAGTLSLKVEPGAVIDITALTDVSALNVKLALALTLDGPTSVTVPGLSGDKTGSSLTLLNVNTVNLTNYDGDVNIGEEVLNFTSNGLVDLSVTGTDLVTFDATGIVDPNATTADKTGPTIDLTGQDLTSVKLTGTVFSATIATNSDLATLDLGGDADAVVVQNAISITGNTALTDVDLTGSTASGITFSTNEELASLSIDTTFTAGLSSAGVAAVAGINGSISIVDNEDLETVDISSTKLETLTVTGNDDLTSLSASGALAATATAAIGATGKATVNIYDNDLTASKFTDTVDTVTTPATAIVNGGVSDIGAITTTSGLNTLKAYLTAVDADADSTAAVYFDTVDSFSPETGAEITTGLEWVATGTQPDGITVLKLTANTADLGDSAVKGKRSFLIPSDNTSIALIANGVDVFGGKSAAASITLVANNAQSVNNMISVASLAQADVAGVTLSATANASPMVRIELGANTTAAENSATLISATGFVFNASDTFTISIDGYSATASHTVYNATGGATADDLAYAFTMAWNLKYSIGTVASDRLMRWTLSSDATHTNLLTAPAAAELTFTAKDAGTGSIGVVPTVTITSGKTATFTNIGYTIGNSNNHTRSTADNGAEGTAVVLTVEADTAGDLLGEIGSPLVTQTDATVRVIAAGGTAVSELNSTYAANSAASAATTPLSHLYPTESRRNDVRVPEEANNAATSNAVSFSRVTWFD